MKLEGKVAVVTGASSGMGWEIALLFAKEGAKVVAVTRRKERLDELVEKAKGLAGTILPYAGDVSLREVNEDMIDTAVKTFGKLDILVNNAGIMDEFTPIGELTDEMWDKVQKVNLYGPMCSCRKAISVMTAQQSGVIVNVASIGGLNGCRAGAAYSASKAGMIALTKNTAFMYANQNIRCNALCPGGVDTEVAVNFSHPSPLGAGRCMLGAGLNQRMGTAYETAAATLFLACDDSSLINGATLVADAGLTAY
ncbi:MAG: SDR family oxidoreductase [Oscillospiraceae bacterium]